MRRVPGYLSGTILNGDPYQDTCPNTEGRHDDNHQQDRRITLFCRSVSMLRIFWSRPRRKSSTWPASLCALLDQSFDGIDRLDIFTGPFFTSSEIAGSPFSRHRFRVQGRRTDAKSRTVTTESH